MHLTERCDFAHKLLHQLNHGSINNRIWIQKECMNSFTQSQQRYETLLSGNTTVISTTDCLRSDTSTKAWKTARMFWLFVHGVAGCGSSGRHHTRDFCFIKLPPDYKPLDWWCRRDLHGKQIPTHKTRRIKMHPSLLGFRKDWLILSLRNSLTLHCYWAKNPLKLCSTWQACRMLPIQLRWHCLHPWYLSHLPVSWWIINIWIQLISPGKAATLSRIQLNTIQ